MIPLWLVGLLIFVYLGTLFAVARFGERRADAGRSVISATVYALAIAVYCTSWTFYGSVGRAVTGGFSFLTIYLGPTVMLLFAGVLLKMIRISKTLRLTSIADFIAARYGKSRLLAGLVTVIAVIGIVPYIALQLKAISYSLSILLAGQTLLPASNFLPDLTVIIAIILAAFTLVFGTRHLDATERHEGMVLAIAFESLFKLTAFLAVGIYVVWFLNDGFGDLFGRAAQLVTQGVAKTPLLHSDTLDFGNWFALTLLSGLVILMLPRQFQIAVVENVDETHVRRAVWLFPLYLLLINLFVFPIALTGLHYFNGQPFDADMLVLTLPLAEGNTAIALLVFLGGLSAATGMVIVETIALATMVSNDLLMPLVLRRRGSQDSPRGQDLSGLILRIRRATIVFLFFLGYLYFRSAGEAYALVSIGLISFLAVAQFAPALLGGIYWQDGNRQGALTGLLLGFAVWLYTALLPSFAKSGWMDDAFIKAGPWGQHWLAAHQLFGLNSLDPIAHTLFWSLLFNIGGYVVVSLLTRQQPGELATATQFVHIHSADGLAPKIWRGTASSEALIDLLKRFLGPQQTQLRLQRYARNRGLDSVKSLPADADFVLFAETQLAGAIGSASAHLMVGSVVQEETLRLDEVLNILDEASQARAHSRALERKSAELEAASRELRAANDKLRELDRLKDDFMSTVTHELRTPLTSIRAFSEMLHDDPAMDEADRTRFLGIIVGEAERLTRLINQILDFAKLESGRVEWQPERLDLGELLTETAASLTQLFNERGARFALALPETSPVLVDVDRDRIKQVVINLLSNALKFVPEGKGQINLRLHCVDGMATVNVSDNGPGIAPAYREQIFERFRQGDQQTDLLTGKPQGTGLGLPISREIIGHFGGRLWVESSSDGHAASVCNGSTFCFTLPLAAD